MTILTEINGITDVFGRAVLLRGSLSCLKLRLLGWAAGGVDIGFTNINGIRSLEIQLIVIFRAAALPQ
jgi:hypothetical protein